MSVFIRLIITKMRIKMKNRSHRYNKNRPKSRHGRKYSKYKKCFSVMMLLCIWQHLSNIWSSTHEKVKQHWSWVETSVAFQKNRVYDMKQPLMMTPFLDRSSHSEEINAMQKTILWCSSFTPVMKIFESIMSRVHLQ